MSPELIDLNPDLKRLREEGYAVHLSNAHLVIERVPYVNDGGQVAYGALASSVSIVGTAVAPKDHTVLWAGGHPCDLHGSPLAKLGGCDNNEQIREGLQANYMFSQKPPEGYRDHHHKMTQYVGLISNEAKAIDPGVNATMHGGEVIPERSIFRYTDTASGRVGITSVNDKLREWRVAIVGLGGTGSYVLDLVAKTPAKEIHIFDQDVFSNHNAFRSPGAPSGEELSEAATKADRFASIYSRMHGNIIKHVKHIDESNVEDLDAMDIVFLCVDNARSRKTIIGHLVENGASFIDVGMGIENIDGSLTGSCRVTSCTPDNPRALDKIPLGEDVRDEYSSNIQVADLNALNAALAVIKWKRMCGFYHDFKNEHHAVYSITTNSLADDGQTQDNRASVC